LFGNRALKLFPYLVTQNFLFLCRKSVLHYTIHEQSRWLYSLAKAMSSTYGETLSFTMNKIAKAILL